LFLICVIIFGCERINENSATESLLFPHERNLENADTKQSKQVRSSSYILTKRNAGFIACTLVGLSLIIWGIKACTRTNRGLVEVVKGIEVPVSYDLAAGRWKINASRSKKENLFLPDIFEMYIMQTGDRQGIIILKKGSQACPSAKNFSVRRKYSVEHNSDYYLHSVSVEKGGDIQLPECFRQFAEPSNEPAADPLDVIRILYKGNLRRRMVKGVEIALTRESVNDDWTVHDVRDGSLSVAVLPPIFFISHSVVIKSENQLCGSIVIVIEENLNAENLNAENEKVRRFVIGENACGEKWTQDFFSVCYDHNGEKKWTILADDHKELPEYFHKFIITGKEELKMIKFLVLVNDLDLTDEQILED
jgi:hypothetical protein